jgi:hypothetical protein
MKNNSYTKGTMWGILKDSFFSDPINQMSSRPPIATQVAAALCDRCGAPRNYSFLIQAESTENIWANSFRLPCIESAVSFLILSAEKTKPNRQMVTARV